MLANNTIRVILAPKYDQLSVGVSGGVCTFGERASLKDYYGTWPSVLRKLYKLTSKEIHEAYQPMKNIPYSMK